MVRGLGRDGIVVMHSCFDRLLQQPLARFLDQNSQLFYHELAKRDATGMSELRRLTQWDISTGCAAHDCQNALKWSLAPFHEGKEDLSALYIVMEALRNSYTSIVAYVPTFVDQHLVIDDAPFDEQAVYE